MAEKPRLKKTDEILGSITVEPAQTARGKRAGSRTPENNGGQQNRGQDAKEKPIKDDYFEESFEIDDGPILPSAQSLAEKLLPKKPVRQRDFSAYAPPKTAKAAKPQATVEVAAPARAAQKPADTTVEFGVEAATVRKPDTAPVEFHAVPAPEKPATIEIGLEEAAAPKPAAPPQRQTASPPRQAQPRQGQQQSPPQQQNQRQPQQNQPQPPRQAPPRQSPPPQQAVQEFEAVQPATVAEYTFQSFEEQAPAENKDAVWEFSAQDAEKQEPPQRRERIIRPLKTENTATQQKRGLSQEQRQEPQRYEPSQEPPQEQRQEAQPYTPPQYEPEPFAPEQRTAARDYAPPSRAEYRQPPAAPEPVVSEDERNRQEFIKRIASQFEVQFEEKFEDGALKPRENYAPPAPVQERPAKREPLFPPREPLAAPVPKRPAMQAPTPLDDQIDGEDFLAYVQRQERERKQGGAGSLRERFMQELEPERKPAAREGDSVLGFIEKFEQDIREEEHQRTEDFKETLSQKFMRERERYLKELEIDGRDAEPEIEAAAPVITPPSAQPPRRKLDFQIQPEMHMQSDMPQSTTPRANQAQSGGARAAGKDATAKPTAGPVTYTRGGTARPQAAEEEAATGAGAFGISIAPERGAGGKKTGEQLLMEHTMRARTPAQPQQAQPAKQLKFTFETPEERAQKAQEQKPKKESVLPTEKWPRRIVFIAMAAGLFSLGLVAWSMISYYNLASGIPTAAESTPNDTAPTVEDTIDVYNDRIFTQTATANNVFFKNAGTLLKNVNVKEHVVIENVDGTGRIRLEDVAVDSAISVKKSAADTLELHNVKAERLIINNPEAGMVLSITGDSDIGLVELRTNSTVKQSGIGIDSEGIRGMLVTAAEAGNEISAALEGLHLRSLETDASNTTLAFSNDTRVETLSASGSLSLSGVGRVSTLSIGAKVGQGAGDTEERRDIILYIKDVAVTNLNVKSPMTLNLVTSVDSISTADAITLGGEAAVGSLTLNPKANSTQRLLIDVVSANIQTVYSNTQSRINVTGASRINDLTADASVYVLGNKVNHLRVNANDVIYENMPDRTTLANGIDPPRSKAESPNIDFNLGVTQQSTAEVNSGDFATTCGHSRESGGFLTGDGSQTSPYEVTTAMQLAHAGLHLASHFVQVNDIDVSTEPALAESFTPIGGAGAPFEGVYNGMGYAITKLKIVSQSDNVGLFGASKGLIQNVRVISGEISAAAMSQSFAGGIVGLNYEGGQIRSSSNGAAVNGNQYTITGGIAGGNYGGRIHDCYSFARVAGVDIVGGIVGLNRQSGSVTGSYNAGAIDGRDAVGAVVGQNDDGTVANCYFLENTSEFGIGAGNGTAFEKTATELANAQMVADISAGNENSLWTFGSQTGGYAYPVHRRPE